MASYRGYRCWLLFFVVVICFLLAHECDYSLGLLIKPEIIIRAIILLLYIIFFSPSTMALFCHYRCWLLYFVIFLCFLPTYECNHLLGYLITLEVLCWAITLLLYIILFSLPAQWRRFTITLFGCHILLFFFISSPRTSATNCWDCW